MVLVSAQNNLYLNPHTYFTLTLSQEKTRALVNINFLTSFVKSASLLNLKQSLSEKLPSIFEHKCFNDKNLPFSKEVLNTEMGHLYEHILIEYIYQMKKADLKNPVIKAVTSWNWNKNPRGFFEIVINTHEEDLYILREAINKTNNLMTYIFKQETAN